MARARFSGHESFPLRFGWLAKGVRLCHADPEGFAKADAMVELGVGKNMVRSIRFWATESKMLAPPDRSTSRGQQLHPTALGALYFAERGVDPYMEDPATTWLIHWNLASRSDGPTTWYWLFNLLRSNEFTKEQAIREIRQLEARCGWEPLSDETLLRDLDCCVRSYVTTEPDKKLAREDSLDCPLAELDLLRRGADRDAFVVVRASRSTLSPSVLAFALVEFWKRTSPQAKSLSFDQIAYAPGSPGQVFKLSENGLMDLLAALENFSASNFTLGTTAGLRQVYLRSMPDDPTTFLKPKSQSRRRHARA